MAKKKKQNHNTLNIFDSDFIQPEESIIIQEEIWPPNEQYPLNIKVKKIKRNTETEVKKDVKSSTKYLILTGFTSLSYIIHFFTDKNTVDFTGYLEEVRILLGWSEEDINKSFSRYKGSKMLISEENKKYWLEEGFSILHHGGAVIFIIDLIKENKINFKISVPRHLHAKIYVGDTHAILGSANFTLSGLDKQTEASIRVCNNQSNPFEKKMYDSINLIANNFYNRGKDYNDEIIKLLQGLFSPVSWQEALARAIHMLLDRDLTDDYPELKEKIENAKLWTFQKQVIGEAFSILQNQGGVLITTPTGSGKTKLISSLKLIIFHNLLENGRRNNMYCTTVAPPLVVSKWDKEKVNNLFPEDRTISQGYLSTPEENKNRQDAIKKIKGANILIVDEAHNYLNTSGRTSIITEHRASNIILATATPISKKAEDLLKLIELLGIDNLEDEQIATYIRLVREGIFRKNDFVMLRSFIWQFMVRKTKDEVNSIIKSQPQNYERVGQRSFGYANQNYSVYETNETDTDNEIAAQIGMLAKKLKGVVYLKQINHPSFQLETEEDEKKYIERRIEGAAHLAVYNVQATLRSSKIALLEHIKGTDFVTSKFEFNTTKNSSGNFIQKIQSLINKGKLPKLDKFKEEYFESYRWIISLDEYNKICNKEMQIYEQIAELAHKISDNRDNAKLEQIERVVSKHPLVLVFDNIVIILDYFYKKLIQRCPNLRVHTITGNIEKGQKENVSKLFALDSQATNVVALCSDCVSEGVDLQGASAIIMLDFPSVLRSAEQRIGRVDRVDTLHDSISIYFPNDSPAFALRTDIKLLRTMADAEYLIGSNINSPEKLNQRYNNEIVSASKYIELIKNTKESEKEEYYWEGIQDAFSPVKSLYLGQSALISEAIYQDFQGVRANIKVKVNVQYDTKNWIFIALKGGKTTPPKWFFIDENNVIHKDLANICDLLRANLNTENKKSEEWTKDIDNQLNKYLEILYKNERKLLPNKRRRALDIAEYLLTNIRKDLIMKGEGNTDYFNTIESLLKAFKTDKTNINDDESVDYYKFADLWLEEIFNARVRELKSAARMTKQKRSIYLENLRDDEETKKRLNMKKLNIILSNTPVIANIWKNVTSCIIGIPMPNT